jgi:superfamily II DNA helicase RecQ
LDLISKSNPANNFITVVDIIRKSHVKDCSIVNCSSRKECDSLAEYLRKYDFNGTSYHAGFTDTER